jgi:sugar phosphate isomerase/epimerase
MLDQFGVISDEMHDELATALPEIRALGCRCVEIQLFDGKTVAEVSDAELDRAENLLAEHGLTVVAIGSQFIKPTYADDDAAFERELELLRAEIRVAQRLGAPIVRSYSFRRDDMVGLGNPSPRPPKGGDVPAHRLEQIASKMRRAAQMAADAGLVLGLENVRSCWANSGHNAGKILDAVDHPNLQAIWDPGNDFVSGGDPNAEGYQAVRGRICLVHVKDAHVVDAATGLTAWDAVGKGDVGWREQFELLARDGYRGPLSLETHWHPKGPNGEPADKVRDSRVSFEGIKEALAARR